MRKAITRVLIALTICLFSVTPAICQKTIKGKASYYAKHFEGRKTATGEVFKNNEFTAASNRFKLGTYVKVTNILNGKSVIVRINDRMGNKVRIIDLSRIAAKALGYIENGLAQVKVEEIETVM